MAAGRNARRLAEVLAAADPAGDKPSPWFEPGVVATVTAGAGFGGTALVEVTWRGGAYELPYLDSYLTPTVGHTVLLMIQPPQVIIFGRVIGRPPAT